MVQKTKKKIIVFILSLLLSFGVGALGNLISKNAPQIYNPLNKPPLSPPSWVFGVVWSVLFFLMGISAALVYLKGRETHSKALGLYLFQFVLNLLWSALFFAWELFAAAFITDILLLCVIFFMIVGFHKASPTAAYLQIPYFLWVAFAGYINLFVLLLN